MAKTLSDSLRQMIVKSGKTAYQLSSETGVVPSVISRFLTGERDIRLETAGKLAAAIGAELKTKAARK